MSDDLRYPIGKFVLQPFSEQLKKSWSEDIKFCPALLENAILDLNESQMQTPYREGGWTVHQVIHHVADSHMNAVTRFKLGLTEERPTIKPYDEAAWADLSDVRNLPVNVSLTFLHALHTRWYELVRNIRDDQWNRIVIHPESNKEMSIWYLLGMYAWHGKHHAAHITNLRERMKW